MLLLLLLLLRPNNLRDIVLFPQVFPPNRPEYEDEYPAAAEDGEDGAAAAAPERGDGDDEGEGDPRHTEL